MSKVALISEHGFLVNGTVVQAKTAETIDDGAVMFSDQNGNVVAFASGGVIVMPIAARQDFNPDRDIG